MPQDEDQSGLAERQTRGIIELVAMREKIETIGPKTRGVIELVAMKEKIETIRQAIPDVDPRDLPRWRAAVDRYIADLLKLQDEIHAAMHPADEG
jgi:hypothetical protein